jgi:hypothetical protein
MTLTEMIASAMREVLSDYESQNGIKPCGAVQEQELKWIELVEDMAKLMEEMTQNNNLKVEKIDLPMPYVLTMLDALYVIKKHKLYGLMGDEEEVKWQIDTVIDEFLDPIANSESTDEIEIVFYD